MSKYSQTVLDDLLRHLDPIDVFELIDYHPESIQLNGDELLAMCPLCQDTSDRYLRIDLKTKRFESRPPHMPVQSGSIIDLYARTRRIDFDAAVEELADEFSVLLLADDDPGQLTKVLAEARQLITEAETQPGQRLRLLDDAEKRLRRLLDKEPNNREALFEEFRLRLLQGNVLHVSAVTMRLMELDRVSGNKQGLVAVGNRHLEVFPNDLAMREKFADELIAAGMKDEAAGELMTLADLAEQNGKPKVALSAYRKVRDLGIGSIDVYPMIITLLTARGKTDEAADELRRHAEVLRSEKRLREARDQVFEILKLKPEDASARALAIDLAVQCGLDEEYTERCIDIADSMVDSNQLAEAVEGLSYLAAELPDNMTVVEMLVNLYKKLGEDEVALDMQLRLVDLTRKAGDMPSAMLIAEELMHANPNHPGVLRVMVDLLEIESGPEAAKPLRSTLLTLQQQAGDWEEVLETAGRIMSGDALNLPARMAAVEALCRLGRSEQAIPRLEMLSRDLEGNEEERRFAEFLERLLAVADAPSIRIMLAAAWERLGEKEKAAGVISGLRKSLGGEGGAAAEASTLKLYEADPENTRLIEVLVEIYRSSGRADKAREFLIKLALAHAKHGAKVEASAAIERFLQADPTDRLMLATAAQISAAVKDDERLLAVRLRELDVVKDGGKLAEVIDQARAVLDLRPDNRKAHREIIKALDASGKKAEALAARISFARILAQLPSHQDEEASVLRDILKAEPNRVEALERLIEILLNRGSEQELGARVDQLLGLQKADRDKSIRLLRELLKRKSSPQLHLRLANIYQEAGRTEEMVAEMQSLIELQETAGNIEEATRLYKDLISKVPDSVSTRAGLILLLRKANRNDEAVEQYLELARILTSQKKPREALQAFEELAELSPDNPEVIRGHAAVLRELGLDNDANAKLRDFASLLGRQGKLERAVTVLQEILEENPGQHETRREIIRLRRESGQMEQAVEELGRLAVLLAKEGDIDGAIATRREAVTLLPNSSEVRLLLIRQLEAAGKAADAERESLGLAQAYSAEALHKKALDILDHLIEANPGNLAARRMRAKVYDDMGDERRALAEYRELQGYMDTVGGVAAASAGALRPSSGEVAVGLLDDGYPQLQIMPEYDFDTYIVGSKNNFAFATSKAVAEHPGSARNPLFLYSEVGLGKTHLLHAIANELKRKRPDIRILYTSTEYFTTELIDAIQNNKVMQFRNKHLLADVLLLDDVQFLAGKERSQEEFFHIFNMLFQKQRQIVVTSDRPPKDIAHLNTRLRSRFGQGVIVDIQPPDVETRMAILLAEAEKLGVSVGNDVVAVLAERITTNVRELKGAFNQLIAQHQIGGQPLTVETAQEIVQKYFN